MTLKFVTLLTFLVPAMAMSADIEVGTRTAVHLSQDLSSAIRYDKVRCGFVKTDERRYSNTGTSLVCKIPVAAPHIASLGAAEVRIGQEKEKSLSALQGHPLDHYFSNAELSVSTNGITIEMPDAVRPLISSALNEDTKKYDAKYEALFKKTIGDLKEVLLQSSQLTHADDEVPFRLNIQRQSFAPLFALVDNMMKQVASAKLITLSRSWRLDITTYEKKREAEMIELICNGAKGSSAEDCAKLKELGLRK